MVTTGSMTSLLDNLEKRGLVRRLPHPDDRRKLLIDITPDAQAIVDELLPTLHARNATSIDRRAHHQRATHAPPITSPSSSTPRSRPNRRRRPTAPIRRRSPARKTDADHERKPVMTVTEPRDDRSHHNASVAGDQPPRAHHDRHGRDRPLLPRRPRRPARRHRRHTRVPSLLLRVRAAVHRRVLRVRRRRPSSRSPSRPACPTRARRSSTTSRSTSPTRTRSTTCGNGSPSADCEVTDIIDHGSVRSVYFTDPNGIALEASWWVHDATGRPADYDDDQTLRRPQPRPRPGRAPSHRHARKRSERTAQVAQHTRPSRLVGGPDRCRGHLGQGSVGDQSGEPVAVYRANRPRPTAQPSDDPTASRMPSQPSP